MKASSPAFLFLLRRDGINALERPGLNNLLLKVVKLRDLLASVQDAAGPVAQR